MKLVGMILLFLGALLIIVQPMNRIFLNLGNPIPPFWGALFLLIGLILVWIDGTAWPREEERR